MTENFLDMGHLPFLHAKTFGDPGRHRGARRTPSSATVGRSSATSATRPRCWPTRTASPSRVFEVDERRSTWWYAAPFALRLRLEYADGVVLTILFFHQPVDERTTKLYAFDLRNDIADGRTTVEDAVAFQLAVAAEDQAMLERLPDTSTPLDLQAEVHTRADRNTVEMRRVLADLVATGGPAR